MTSQCSIDTNISQSQPAIDVPHGTGMAITMLGLGGLFIGTGEFASMSLLPGLASSTDVSIPVAGGYITAYALGVVVGAPLIAILAARWPRKALLIALLALFAVGYGASALAWNYTTLLGARFLAGLPHGAYYGVACLVAATMVAENRKAQAAGYVMAGWQRPMSSVYLLPRGLVSFSDGEVRSRLSLREEPLPLSCFGYSSQPSLATSLRVLNLNSVASKSLSFG